MSSRPSCTAILSLVEGLSSSQKPVFLFKEALSRWEALQTIRRALRVWVSSRTTGPRARKRRKCLQQQHPASFQTSSSSSGLLLSRGHWLWIALWDSSVAPERKAAAQIVWKALKEVTKSDVYFWKYRLARVFVEFHAQRNNRKDYSIIPSPKTDHRRVMEGVVWLFDLLYGHNNATSKAGDAAAEEVPPAAFLLACNHSLAILKLWSKAVWETSDTAVIGRLEDEVRGRTGQIALWNALLQWLVQTDRPDDMVWLQKLREALWTTSRAESMAVSGKKSGQWTSLACLIAAKVRTDTSPMGAMLEHRPKVSSSQRRSPFATSISSSSSSPSVPSKGSGAPSNLLSTITDPFHGPIKLVECKPKTKDTTATQEAKKVSSEEGQVDEGHEGDQEEEARDRDHIQDGQIDLEHQNDGDDILREVGDQDDDDDDEDEEEEDDDEDDDDELDDDEAMEIDMDDFDDLIPSPQVTHSIQATLRNLGVSTATASASDEDDNNNGSSSPSKDLLPPLPERRKYFLQASLQVVSCLYPPLPSGVRRRVFLTAEAENAIWEGMTRVIQPPKPPAPPVKIILRRAPTQEEFFRGNLSTNPVDLDLLRRRSINCNAQSNDAYEPTVADLRQHIANDLQMGDSAELIEILIANKIVSTDLKLRLIHQVVWKQHLLENSTTSRDGGQSFVSMGSGISMIFSSSRPGRGHNAITVDTPPSQLPPMIAVYRLAGLDGEATEDTVDEVVDPEAPYTDGSPEAKEATLEKEFGLTRIIAGGRGFHVLLRSIQHTVESSLCRIRRDQVGLEHGESNMARELFQNSPPCQGLVLLRHCAKLPSNRKLLLCARAPTVLLTLLLEVLQVLSHSGSENHSNNPTADILQELIETLTTDISASSSSSANEEAEGGFSTLDAQDASSMSLLLESIENISLKANLRGVISKLLPYLTYGQAELSKSLAQHFTLHIAVEELAKCEDENPHSDTMIMMKTFVETLIGLPASGVCNAFRAELIHCNFIDKIAQFVLKGIPSQPPSWSPALWSKKDMESIYESGPKKKILDDAWRSFFGRRGLRTAVQMLIGLCKNHKSTQARVAIFNSMLQSLHWIEATSDSSVLEVETNGLGLLAETLLDELIDENLEVSRLVEDVRRKTKIRKRELAQERRTKAIGTISSFGPLSGGASSKSLSSSGPIRGTASSIFGSVVDFLGSGRSTSTTASAKTRSGKVQKENAKKVPAWMAEMEDMEEETGITCAICHEGQKLQPVELLGLYCYVTKVAIPLDKCGARSSLDGSTLFKSLPGALPLSLAGDKQVKEWFSFGKAAAAEHSITSSYCSTMGGRRYSLFTTTVSAGNAIHISCHRKAKQVDRNHPKAPKSEWEGAKLRNGRVDCNIILPLVSCHSSKVPLVAVDSALSEHQSSISSILGTNAKSSLWTTLFDARFLLLRFAYGESLNADCGGGSLASNCSLLFHHLAMGEMFEKSSLLEQPETSQHVRCLSSAFLAACALVTDPDCCPSDGFHSALTRGVADSAPLAALTCILLHNQHDDTNPSEEVKNMPHPRRRWLTGRVYFLKSFVIAAGRHKALGIDGSGCLPVRNSNKRLRSSSFADWDDEAVLATNTAVSQPTIEDFQNVLRPMLTLFAIFETISMSYHGQMDDSQVQESCDALVEIIQNCLGSKSLQELMEVVKVDLGNDELVNLIQQGMAAA